MHRNPTETTTFLPSAYEFRLEHETRKRKRMTNGSGSLEEFEMVSKRDINNCWRGEWLRMPGHEAFRCEASAYLTSLYFLFFSFILYDFVAGCFE